jgi:Acetyltransferase (GNAT) domain
MDSAARVGYRTSRRKPMQSGETDHANAIFQQPWWLDAVAPGRWEEATVERNGRVVARLPFVVRGRRPLRLLSMPPLTQTLGPWVERSAASPARALGDELALLEELEGALPPSQGFVQAFSPTVLNALPFHWAGYRLEVQYTYRLAGIRSEELLWDGLRGNIRREIRKARRLVEVRDDLGLDRLYSVWIKTYARQDLEPPVSLAALERLEAACAARGARTMLFAQDEAQRLHAAAYFVWDHNGAFFLLGGGDPELRTSGASSLLMWEGIRRAGAVTDVFDFEGSMLKPVERFFRAFGSRQTPYLRVSRLGPSARAAFTVQAGWRRLLAARRGSARQISNHH